MSFPKIRDFIGKVDDKNQYKSISLNHSLKNSLNRNTITPSHKLKKTHFQSLKGSRKKTFQNASSHNIFKYQQCLPSSFQFTDQDLDKLLHHLFNKKQHDFNDRNFIRRIMLKYFPEDIVCAGGREFVTHIKYLKIKKNQVINVSRQKHNQTQISQNMFYFVLRGKLLVSTSKYEYKKCSSQYFGQFQILSSQPLRFIKAKTDTILLTIKQQVFNQYLSSYFKTKQQKIIKQISLVEPIINLTTQYYKLIFLNKIYEKQYKTGEKVIQKGEVITQIVFFNHVEMSFTQDKILNQFKAVGLTQYVTSDQLIAKETIYCMENASLSVIKIEDFERFIPKASLLNFIGSKFVTANLSQSKLVSQGDDLASSCSQQHNITKLQQFCNVKKVKFFGSNRRVLTQPNGSSFLVSPKSNAMSKYPQFTTSFVFIKQNSSQLQGTISAKSNRIKNAMHKFKHRQTHDYLMKTRSSLKTKRWLDQFNVNQSSVICNPQRLLKGFSTQKKITMTGNTDEQRTP